MNDTILLLDAGGGTVDAAAYSITGRGRDVTLKREIVMGDGMGSAEGDLPSLTKMDRTFMWL
jgi:hypothetical protein